jgi:hypothetical protein
MTSAKLDRLEAAEWSPPILIFVIERHGAAALGSSRAEVQEWRVDVVNGNAECRTRTTRQIRPRGSAFDAEGVAEMIATAVLKGEAHPHVEVRQSGVKVLVDLILPPVGPNATITLRRKRLRTALLKRLRSKGYRETKPWLFEMPG